MAVGGDVQAGDAEALGLAVLEDMAVAEAHLFAEQARQLAELIRLSEAAHGVDGVERFLVMDVAGTLRTGQMSATTRLMDAQRLVQVLTRTLEALEDGRLLLPQARTVLRETNNCSERVAAEVERRVLAVEGPEELAGWTAKRLRDRVKAAVIAVEAELEPADTEEREQRARDGRRVCVSEQPDGMASIWALIPAEQARALDLGMDELCRRQRLADTSDGVERTCDQRRADLLGMLPALALHALDLAGRMGSGGGGSSHPGPDPGRDANDPGSRPVVGPLLGAGHPSVTIDIHVPMATVLGHSAEPGALAGYGPISARRIRLLLPEAKLRRVLVDATTGEPIHVGRPTAPAGSGAAARQQILAMMPPGYVAITDSAQERYEPNEELRRLVRLRDPLCLGPGCSRSSHRSDLDHNEPWPHGPTSAWNLQPLSRRCHRAKTLSWQVRRRADGGRFWTSPTGRSYLSPSTWRRPPRLPRDDDDGPPPRG